MKLLCTASSLFLVFAFSWFITMELILHHPGFILRAAVASAVVLYGALTIFYLRTPTIALRHILTVASLTAITLGLFGLLAALHQTHFEGYLFLLALALLAQSVLTLINTLQPPRLRTA